MIADQSQGQMTGAINGQFLSRTSSLGTQQRTSDVLLQRLNGRF